MTGRAFSIILLAFVLCGIAGCKERPVAPQPEAVQVEPAGGETKNAASGIVQFSVKKETMERANTNGEKKLGDGFGLGADVEGKLK